MNIPCNAFQINSSPLYNKLSNNISGKKKPCHIGKCFSLALHYKTCSFLVVGVDHDRRRVQVSVGTLTVGRTD